MADRAAASDGWRTKLWICLCVCAFILPCSLLINATKFPWVMTGVPLYFTASGIVTAVGFSAVLDIIPHGSRGLAMSIAFFLNVAVGAGLGPTAVALAHTHLFAAQIGLGPPIVATVVTGYLLSLAALAKALSRP